MALHDPIAVYNAESNAQAHALCDMLLDAGIEAAVVEDQSPAGMWMFGLLPEIHKPQVWIDRADIDRARPLLREFERREAERRLGPDVGPFVSAVCEECRRSTLFPASRLGCVEICPHCGAFVDVGEECEIEGREAPGDRESDQV